MFNLKPELRRGTGPKTNVKEASTISQLLTEEKPEPSSAGNTERLMGKENSRQKARYVSVFEKRDSRF